MVVLVPDRAKREENQNKDPEADDTYVVYKHHSKDMAGVVLTETLCRLWDHTDGQDRVMCLDADGLEALRAKGRIPVRYWKVLEGG